MDIQVEWNAAARIRPMSSQGPQMDPDGSDNTDTLFGRWLQRHRFQ